MKLLDMIQPPKIFNKREEKIEIDTKELGPKDVLLSWEAQSRAIKKGFNSKISRTFMIIAIVIGLILIIMQEYFLIIVVASILFFIYAVSKSSPESARYEISTHGIRYNEDMYYWLQLDSFFFADIDGLETLCVDTRIGLPGRLFITITGQNKENLKKILDEYLHYIPEAPKTSFDKAYEKIMDKFNFEE